MPRKAIYILLTKSGPAEADQFSFIRDRVRVANGDPVYVDDVTRMSRTREAIFPERDNLLRQKRKGDSMVIATPGRLGIGRDDIRQVLHDLRRADMPLIVASTGRTLVWSDEIDDALQFFDRAMLEHKQDAARNARRASVESGWSIVAKEKEFDIPLDEARAMWFDRARYPSPGDIARKCGVSPRTLYNRLGKRVLEGTPRKLTPTMKTPDGRNYVYVLARKDGRFKIGFSSDPLKRQRDLEAQLLQPLRLVHHVIRPGDARSVETVAHSWLIVHHEGNEWFKVTLDQAKEAVAWGCRVVDNTNIAKRRAAIVEAAEKTAGRRFSRQEVTDLLRSMNELDEPGSGPLIIMG